MKKEKLRERETTEPVASPPGIEGLEDIRGGHQLRQSTVDFLFSRWSLKSTIGDPRVISVEGKYKKGGRFVL